MAALEEPKKPLTAYFLYINQVRPEIQKELGTSALGPVAKLAGERWKAMPSNEKAVFEKQANEKKMEYDEAIKVFKEAGGEVGKKRKDTRDAKAKKAEKRARKEQNADAPKRPAGGAYGVYVTMHREEIMTSLPSGSKCTEVSKLAGQRFKALSEEERSVYEAKYQEKKAKYEEEIKAWKAKQGAAAVNETPRKTPRGSTSTPNKPSGKRAKTSASGSTASSGCVLPAAVTTKAQELGQAETGVSYLALLQKLLATPDLAQKGLNADDALMALQKNGGNVSITRQKLRDGIAI